MEIKLAERHSDEGGFDCIMIESVDGSDHYTKTGAAIGIMRSWGMIWDIRGGYYTVRQRVLNELGMEFTDDQLYDLGDRMDAEEKAARANDVRCDCGHKVPKVMVMHGSRGTCCPDCYDRMSD